jgi:hypothetical protein
LTVNRYESPPGIKQNLLRTYESWDPAYIAQGSITRAQMLFILAWFHAIVQERRTFIPQGEWLTTHPSSQSARMLMWWCADMNRLDQVL